MALVIVLFGFVNQLISQGSQFLSLSPCRYDSLVKCQISSKVSMEVNELRVPEHGFSVFRRPVELSDVLLVPHFYN